MGMLVNMGPGANITPGPIDVCKILVVVPIPVPCINMGMWMTGVPPVVMILIDGLPAMNIMSMVMVTPIDDPTGPLGGLVSEVIVGIQKALLGNPLILQEGGPALEVLLTQTTANLINAEAAAMIPSQFQVIGLP